MIKLATKTLEAVDVKIVENNDNSHRIHLGASIIGDSCARKLWYTFRWTQKGEFSARVLRLFDRGFLEEPRIVKWLQEAGVQVWEVDNKGNQYRISDCGGHFGGSMDGVGLGIPDLPEGVYALLEFKTHNDKSFKDLEKKGVKQSKPQHYVQMQIYMRKGQLNHALYIAVNKNTDALYMELITLDENYADTFLARANRIILSTQAPPRLNNNPTWYECKWCDFHKICHHGAPAEVNCRTCRYCSPADKKQWICKLGNTVNEYLHTGCSNHRYFPDMIGGYDQMATERSTRIRLTILESSPLL